eukprot:5252383-Amphidinium_carterae.1
MEDWLTGDPKLSRRPSLSKKYAPSYAACFCLSNLGNTESLTLSLQLTQTPSAHGLLHHGATFFPGMQMRHKESQAETLFG